jgi:hypothetical protein
VSRNVRSARVLAPRPPALRQESTIRVRNQRRAALQSGEAQTPRTRALSLAQVVILSVIPQATTAPNQTGLNRISAQPDLARPDWTVQNRRSAVISETAESSKSGSRTPLFGICRRPLAVAVQRGRTSRPDTAENLDWAGMVEDERDF